MDYMAEAEKKTRKNTEKYGEKNISELLIYLSRVRVPEGALKSAGFADRELRGRRFFLRCNIKGFNYL